MEEKISKSQPSAELDTDTSSVSRDSFDSHWLQVKDCSIHSRKFAEHRIVEKDGSRAQIQPLLAEALRDHHINRKRIADCLRNLNHSQAADYFAQELPKDDRTRKGNFGEVIASEHLIQRYGFSMPVFKLRHRDSHLPMRGEDIVAFELNEEQDIIRVIIGEAKAVVKFKKQTVTEAHERLKSAFNPRPMTLSMLSNILYEQGNDTLGEKIDRISFTIQERGFPCSNWIFLINETQPDDPFQSLADKSDQIDNLHCIGIKLPDLSHFVDELYNNVLELIEKGN